VAFWDVHSIDGLRTAGPCLLVEKARTVLPILRNSKSAKDQKDRTKYHDSSTIQESDSYDGRRCGNNFNRSSDELHRWPEMWPVSCSGRHNEPRYYVDAEQGHETSTEELLKRRRDVVCHGLPLACIV